MKLNLSLFTVCFFILVSCNAPSTEQASSENTTQANSGQKLPSITLEIMQKLFDKCDYVDYLFYDTNFSMSMNNKASIQQTLTHVAENVAVLDPNCKSIGRVFYEIEGQTEIEAEIYFSNQCQYFVFMKNQKPIYANNITAAGVTHFNNIFKQAEQMGK